MAKLFLIEIVDGGELILVAVVSASYNSIPCLPGSMGT